jgi:hypothetical protein
MMRIATFSPLRSPMVHEMKSRIVGSLSEFAKDEPTQKSAGFDGGFGYSAFDYSNKTKSQQIIKHS